MIVTLSRQTAAGARTIGAELGQRLGGDVIDVTIRRLVAQRLHTMEEAVTALDERLEPTGVRILRSLGAAVAPETSVAPNACLDVTAADVEQATRQVIRDLAVHESVVIIGRGARWILGNWPDVLHVRLVAPLEVRVERYMAKERTDRTTAHNVVRSTDRARAAHIQRYFHVDWNDPENYHLVLNTGLLSLSTAADLIVAAVRELTDLSQR